MLKFMLSFSLVYQQENNFDENDENNNVREVSVDEELISITIKKTDSNKGYGMSLSVPNPNLNTSSFPVITKIEINSPAENFGLKKDDQLVEINGNNTLKKSNPLITDYIRSSGDTLRLLVRRKRDNSLSNTQRLRSSTKNSNVEVDKQLTSENDSNDNSFNNNFFQNITKNSNNEDSTEYVNQKSILNETNDDAQNYENINVSLKKMEINSSKIQMNSSSTEEDHSVLYSNSDEFKPRLCKLISNEELGFYILGSRTRVGVFKVSEIVPNSPAEYSGLKNGDFIIEVNNKSVNGMSYQELVSFIKAKKEENNLQILVADKNTMSWYKEKNIPISSSMIKVDRNINDEESEKNVSLNNTTNQDNQISDNSINADGEKSN